MFNRWAFLSIEPGVIRFLLKTSNRSSQQDAKQGREAAQEGASEQVHYAEIPLPRKDQSQTFEGVGGKGCERTEKANGDKDAPGGIDDEAFRHQGDDDSYHEASEHIDDQVSV